MTYYCDEYSCLFEHDGWCSFRDSTTTLMKIRGISCKMNEQVDTKIDEIMKDVVGELR